MYNYEDFRKVAMENMISEEEINKLFIEMKYGIDNAREKLQLGNLYIVVKALSNLYITNSYDIEELISIGTVSLLESIDKYSLKTGVSFEVYASHFINEACKKYIYNKLLSKDEQSLYSKIEITSKKTKLVMDTLIENDDYLTEDSDDLSLALSKLNPIERQVILLSYGFKGKSFNVDEISEILNIDIFFVSSILSMSIEKLQRYMNKESKDIKIKKIIINNKGNN
ncbi:MAG TPA: sigma-70 family RNA polymerase sigma factor [Bacilli bacterium]|nr:sigma-70 family RNA polymerase sigma factor [Bacilli bacterium]